MARVNATTTNAALTLARSENATTVLEVAWALGLRDRTARRLVKRLIERGLVVKSNVGVVRGH